MDERPCPLEMREELVRQIQGELARLNRLISDVAAVSRLDAELAYGGSEPVDVRDLLRGVMAIFQDRCSSSTLELVLDIQDRWLPADAFIVMGHEARLGRVITNLLDNAISFSPEGGVVAVRARRLDTAIEIIVDDDGPGIPADKLDEIFERFYSDRPQSDSTLGKNSGLGLSISRDIIDAYGGCVEASNRLAGGGAAMTRRVPCPPAPGLLEGYAAQFDDQFASVAQRRALREYLHGLTPDGEIFRFAENNIVLPPEFQQSKGYSGDFTGSEWAGATFEPKNGNWLFVNIQSPGITFAITGPWGQGAL